MKSFRKLRPWKYYDTVHIAASRLAPQIRVHISIYDRIALSKKKLFNNPEMGQECSSACTHTTSAASSSAAPHY